MGATMADHDKRCMMWCMQRTNIYLEERQTELLDQLAIDQGVSRAEIIRRLLDRSLEGADDDLMADLRAIDESFGSVQRIDVPDRGRGDREAHLERVWRTPA